MANNGTGIEAQFVQFQQDDTMFYTICEEIGTQDIIVNPQNDSNVNVSLKQHDSPETNKNSMDGSQNIKDIPINVVQQVAMQQSNSNGKQIYRTEQPMLFQDECVEICLPVIQQKWSEDFTTQNIILHKNEADSLLLENFQLKKLLALKDQENEKLKRQLSLLRAEKQKLVEQNQALKFNFNSKCEQIQQINKGRQSLNYKNQQSFKTHKNFFPQKNQVSKNSNRSSLNALLSPAANSKGDNTERKNRLLTKYMLPPTPRNNIKGMIDELNQLSLSLDVIKRQQRDRSIDVTNNIQAKEDILKNVSKWVKKQKDIIIQEKPKPKIQDVISPRGNNKPKISHNKSQFIKKNWK